MKVLHLSTTESSGGAGMAANRLHKGLQKAGIQSRMLVQHKKSDDWSIYGPRSRPVKYLYQLRAITDSLPLYLYPGRTHTPFSPALTSNVDFGKIRNFDPDIIHLHWINTGFLGIHKLAKFGKPVLWTFHDMWPMTGGCHYDEDCGKYESRCGSCPQLGSARDRDLSNYMLKKKQKYWQPVNINVVTPSRWLADCAGKSTLFRDSSINVVPNGLDLEVYKPAEKKNARALWSLADDRKYILFGAVNSTSSARKGFRMLNKALHALSAKINDKAIELVVFGATEPEFPGDYGFRVNYVGELHDDISLVSLYSAVDVFVAPSLQDNLPNTVIEAMSCALPVVAFDIGGMPDMIDHLENGYLAKPCSTEDFADGIHWVLEDSARYKSLSGMARKKAETTFGLEKCVTRYTELYKTIMPGPA